MDKPKFVVDEDDLWEFHQWVSKLHSKITPRLMKYFYCAWDYEEFMYEYQEKEI